MEHIVDRESDIVFLTETWLQFDKNSVTAEIKTYGYELLHDRRKDREKDGGGGVGIMVKTSIPAKQLPAKHYHSFEHTIVKIPLANKRILFLICIYRLQFIAIDSFFEELAELFDQFVVTNEDLIISGDMNIHLDTDCPNAKELRDLMELYDLKQHITNLLR